MKMKIIVSLLLFIVGVCQKDADAAPSLVASGGLESNGLLQVCPGTTINLICSHSSSSDASRWVITPPLTPDCNTIITHTDTPNTESMCGPYTVTMISARSETIRSSTLELVVNGSLGGAQVICHAGSSTDDPQVGNFTIQLIGAPSPPTAGTLTYFIGNSITGQVTFEVNSAGTFGTGVSFYHSLLGDGDSPELTNGTITVTGLSYTESHTVNVMATSSVCPGVINSSSSIDVPVNFTKYITTPRLSIPTPTIECSNSSLPVTLSWMMEQGPSKVNADSSERLIPPLIGMPSVSISPGGITFMSDSPFTISNLNSSVAYTFTLLARNAAGPSDNAELPNFLVTSLSVSDASVSSDGCLMVDLGPNCMETTTNSNFNVKLEYARMCTSIDSAPMTLSINQSLGQDTCIPVGTISASELCFRASLLNDNDVIQRISNEDFRDCPVSELISDLGSGITVILDSSVSMVSHRTLITLHCSGVSSGESQAICMDGSWTIFPISCSIATWLIVVIVILALVAFAVGVLVGAILAVVCLKALVAAINDGKCWAILVVIICTFLLGVGFGILIYTCYAKSKSSQKKSSRSDKDGLTQSRSSLPPPDSMYADPSAIEHQTTSDGTEYAMVDRKVKEKKHNNPALPDSVYQDPTTIEHQIVASGDTYAVVDKPKKDSKKNKGGPDVVPPPRNEGLTYAQIDLGGNNKHQQPRGDSRHAQQQPGELPVEYSSVDHGQTNTEL